MVDKLLARTQTTPVKRKRSEPASCLLQLKWGRRWQGERHASGSRKLVVNSQPVQRRHQGLNPRGPAATLPAWGLPHSSLKEHNTQAEAPRSAPTSRCRNYGSERCWPVSEHRAGVVWPRQEPTRARSSLLLECVPERQRCHVWHRPRGWPTAVSAQELPGNTDDACHTAGYFQTRSWTMQWAPLSHFQTTIPMLLPCYKAMTWLTQLSLVLTAQRKKSLKSNCVSTLFFLKVIYIRGDLKFHCAYFNITLFKNKHCPQARLLLIKLLCY